MYVDGFPDAPPVDLYLLHAYLQNPETPSLRLASGETITPDLVVAADGVNSIAVESVLGEPNPPEPQEHYNCCYRFLIPVSVLESDPETAFFNVDRDGKMRLIVDNVNRRRLVCYPCRKYGLPLAPRSLIGQETTF